MTETQIDIKKVLDSSAGKALKDFLLTHLMALCDINAVKEKDTPTHQAVELKAQKRAYAKLKEIYDEIMTLSGDVEQRDPRDSYHVE